METACNRKQLTWELQLQGTEGINIVTYLLFHQDTSKLQLQPTEGINIATYLLFHQEA